MTLNQFIQTNGVEAADAIVVKKNDIGLLDHYLIYLGFHNGEHKFIANYFQGTRVLSYSELNNFSQQFSPARINKFKGNQIQRNAAVNRALSRKDQVSYHLLLNNCEHFASYVQTGKSRSEQTTAFGTTLAIAGLSTAALAKNDAAKGTGMVMAALGLLALLIENKD